MNPESKNRVIFSGWNIGFQKVRFTKMLQEELGLRLAEAKKITDGVLERKQVNVHIADRDHSLIAKRAEELGAVVVAQEGETACQ